MKNSGGRLHVKQRLGIRPQDNGIQRQSRVPLEGDARFTLIERKRNNITDARERLAEIAKQEDARVKLNKIKNSKLPPLMSLIPKETQPSQKLNVVKKKEKVQPLMSIRPLMSTSGKAVSRTTTTLKKTITGQGSVTTGTTRLLKGGGLTRTVNGIQRTPKKPSPGIVKRASDSTAERYHPLPGNPSVVTIRNEKATVPPKNRESARSSLPQLKAKRTHPSASVPSLFSVSSRREPPKLPLTRTFTGNVWEQNRSPFPMQQESNLSRIKITTANNYMGYAAPQADDEWRSPPPPQPRVPAVKRPMYDMYESYEAPPPPPPKKQMPLSSSIVSRLDQPRRPPQNPGYKVMVTNLHPIVTLEDVEELFRNIGSIRQARIVREGIAEVTFHNEEDAYRSVEIYHNRQLDGQAMNVTFVTKKSSANVSTSAPSRYSPTRPRFSPPQPRVSDLSQHFGRKMDSGMSGNGQVSLFKNSQPTKSVLRTAGGSDSAYDTSLSSLVGKGSQKVDISPDISAIHHALFSGRGSYTDSNLQVYIKLPKPSLRGK